MEDSDQNESGQAKKTISKQLFFSLLLLCILLITGFSFVISPAFSIGTVTVAGNSYMTEEEIFELAGIPEKINIFRLHTGELQTRLCKDLRIEAAQVTRNFPSTLVITVTERRPIAYVTCDYGFVEVDRNGTILAAHKTMKSLRVPMITGIALHNLYVGDRVEDATALAVLSYLSGMNEQALSQMSEVNMANKEQLIGYTNNSIQIRIGNTDRLAEKAKLTQNFLAEVKAKKLPVEYIDFNFASPFIKLKNRIEP